MRPKIIIPYPHFTYPRGATKYTLEVAERLSKRGYDCLVVTTVIDPLLTNNYPHIKFACLGSLITSKILFWLTYPLFQIKFHRLLNSIPHKILLPHVMPSSHWALIYKKFHPEVPLVWICHEPSAFIHSLEVIESLKEPATTFLKITRPLLEIIDKWLIKSADYIIVNSKFTAHRVKKIYHKIPAGLAYPGVDFQKFHPSREKKNYLFTISGLDKVKKIDVLISAFANLPKSLRKEFPLIIGGEGREKKNLKFLATKLGVAKEVKFLGQISERELPRWYSQAKIVIFPAVDEPFGIVSIEAIASGIPVIATRSGGMKETIVEGATGFFFKPDDSDDLAKTLFNILKNKKSLPEISFEARNSIKKSFSWEATVDVIEKFLMKAKAKIAKTAG